MTLPQPRNYTAAAHPPFSPTLPGPGLPQERMARIAARRAFVEMKQRFLRAVTELDASDEHAPWLRHQVRQAQEPEDLWLLRSAVFNALRRDPRNGPRTRYELKRGLDNLFPGSFVTSTFTAF